MLIVKSSPKWPPKSTNHPQSIHSLPKDLSNDFYHAAQLRADQLFRDAIEEHRAKVKDTDPKNPGHMEAAFRKNVTNYMENLIGVDDSISDELVTEGRWKEKRLIHPTKVQVFFFDSKILALAKNATGCWCHWYLGVKQKLA